MTNQSKADAMVAAACKAYIREVAAATADAANRLGAVYDAALLLAATPDEV